MTLQCQGYHRRRWVRLPGYMHRPRTPMRSRGNRRFGCMIGDTLRRGRHERWYSDHPRHKADPRGSQTGRSSRTLQEKRRPLPHDRRALARCLKLAGNAARHVGAGRREKNIHVLNPYPWPPCLLLVLKSASQKSIPPFGKFGCPARLPLLQTSSAPWTRIPIRHWILGMTGTACKAGGRSLCRPCRRI